MLNTGNMVVPFITAVLLIFFIPIVIIQIRIRKNQKKDDQRNRRLWRTIREDKPMVDIGLVTTSVLHELKGIYKVQQANRLMQDCLQKKSVDSSDFLNLLELQEKILDVQIERIEFLNQFNARKNTLERCDLLQLVLDAKKMHEIELQRKVQLISIKSGYGEYFSILNPRLFLMAVMAILNNSSEATFRNAKTPGEIRINITWEGDLNTISFLDNGGGISYLKEGQIETDQFEIGKTEKDNGGLGIISIINATRLNNGTVRFFNHSGKGFEVRLSFRRVL